MYYSKGRINITCNNITCNKCNIFKYYNINSQPCLTIKNN